MASLGRALYLLLLLMYVSVEQLTRSVVVLLCDLRDESLTALATTFLGIVEKAARSRQQRHLSLEVWILNSVLLRL